jgi:pheromone shutdown protein TraB
MQAIIVRADGVKVHLIGTCHLSDEAAQYTAARVRELQPRTVVIELCEERRPMLFRPARPATQRSAQLSAQSAGGSILSVIMNWTSLIGIMYSSFEALMDRQTGAEFSAAARAANEVGARLVLGDRLSSVTLGRLTRLIPPRELLVDVHLMQQDHAAQQAIERARILEACRKDARAVSRLTRELARKPRDSRASPAAVALAALEQRVGEVETAVAQAHAASVADAVDGVIWQVLRKFWARELISAEDKARLRWAVDQMGSSEPTDTLPPTLHRVLVDERDAILAAALGRAEGPTVVGVVGAAHMPGIEQWFARGLPSEDELASYTTIPSWRPRPWHGVAGLSAGALAYGAYRSRALQRTLKVSAVGAVLGVAWLGYEVGDRIACYERMQRQAAAVDPPR